MNAGHVIMVGPDPRAHGGVAAVAATLLAEPALGRFDVEYVSTWREGGPMRRAMSALRGIARFAWRVRPGDIAHIHMASRGSFARKLAVIGFARLRGAHVLIHLHGAQFHTFSAEAPAMVRSVIRSALNSADEVLVLSDVWKARVEAITGRADCMVIPNPVVVPKQSALMEGAPHAVFLGRLGERKGTPELLEAIASLQRDGDETTWTLAGDGELARFRELAERLPFPGKIRMPGWLPASEGAEELTRAWVFCLPSHDEGKPIALLEAMAAGVACAATPVGGIPDLITDGVNGAIVPVGDADALSVALKSLLTSRERCLRYGAAGRALVTEGYASAHVGATLAALYDRIFAEGAA